MKTSQKRSENLGVQQMVRRQCSMRKSWHQNVQKKDLRFFVGSQRLRILEAKKSEKGMLALRQVGGGWLAQDSDDLTPEDIKFNVMSERVPQGEEHDAEFAWLCVKHVKSNAVVIAKLGRAPLKKRVRVSETKTP